MRTVVLGAGFGGLELATILSERIGKNIVKQGVKFRQENITAIELETRSVTASNVTYQADILVIALGANYNIDTTPGLAECGNEFYSFATGIYHDASKAHS